MYIGWVLFFVLAVVLVVIGAIAMKRRSDYGNSEIDDDFDFDEYEGFNDK